MLFYVALLHKTRTRKRDFVVVSLQNVLRLCFPMRNLLVFYVQSRSLTVDNRPDRLVATSLKMSYMQCHYNVWPPGNMVYGLVKQL